VLKKNLFPISVKHNHSVPFGRRSFMRTILTWLLMQEKPGYEKSAKRHPANDNQNHSCRLLLLMPKPCNDKMTIPFTLSMKKTQ